MKGRTNQLPSDPASGSESVNARAHRTSSAQRGGKHSEASAETETWLEQVLDATNMQRAWQRVRRNRGAPGMDGMSSRRLPASTGSEYAPSSRKGRIAQRPCAVFTSPNPMGRSGPSEFRRCWIE